MDFPARKFGKKECIGFWIKMIDSADFSKPDIMKFLTPYILAGIPDEVRPAVWLKFASVGISNNFSHIGLEENIPENVRDSIRRDIERTFVATIGNTKAGSKVQSLQRILESYAAIIPDVGYTQGMNFIASVPLIITDESTAFKIFFGAMEAPHLYLHDCYESLLPGCNVMCRVWLKHVERRFPWLQDIFRRSINNPGMTIMKMLQSLTIAMDIPLELKMIVFDRFIAFGRCVVISFASTVIRLMGKQIRKESDPSQAVCILLSSVASPDLADVSRFVQIWNEEWITQEEFQELLSLVSEDAPQW